MTRFAMLAALVTLTAAPASLAQSQESRVLKDREAVTFEEVERGFYFGLTAGPSFMINPPASGSSAQPLSPGQMAQVELGYDIGDRISIGLYVRGTQNRAGTDYTGKSGGVASGDFASLSPGATARISLVGFNDDQEVRRTWFYVRGGVGYLMFFPNTLLPDSDVAVFAGPGLEYFTRLRHFSIGLEITGTMLLSQGAIGIAVTPNLRYAF
jgi:opacity protein-like surface antigen